MRHAIVTGAGTGIGRAAALRFAQDGFAMSLLGRRPERLLDTRTQITQAGGAAHVFPVDVTDAAAVSSAVERACADLGPVFALVNNAGANGRGTVAEGDHVLFDRVVRTNLTGPFVVSAAVLPHMEDGGRILLVGSILSKMGVPGYSAYAASKHGLVGLTRCMALECAPRRITVNCICPGWTATEMAQQGISETARSMGITPEAFWEEARRAVPLGRMSTPDEIAGLMAYLISAAAANLTGQTLFYDGGAFLN